MSVQSDPPPSGRSGIGGRACRADRHTGHDPALSSAQRGPLPDAARRGAALPAARSNAQPPVSAHGGRRPARAPRGLSRPALQAAPADGQGTRHARAVRLVPR